MIKPEDLRKMTPAQRAALSRKEVGARAQGQMKKPKPIKPMVPRKNSAPVPMPGIKDTDGRRPLPLIGGRNSTPVPMPKINPGPRTRKPQPLAGPKKKSPGVAATPQTKKPKIKITGKASTSGGRAADTPFITRRGSIAQSPKFLPPKKGK